MSSGVVGLDVGTSSARALAFDGDGRLLASAARTYELVHPGPGRAELDPRVVADAACAALAQVCSQTARVRAVALSTFMHSLVALDDQERPLTGLVTWADARSAAQTTRLARRGDALALYQRTGVPLHPMSPLTKLLWFAEEEPDVFRRAARWVSIKELLLHRLTGEWVVDRSAASTSGLLQLDREDWDEGALAAAGIERAQLADLVSPVETLRARESDLVVVPGAADGVLANLGVGAVSPETLVCSIGTSGAVRATVPEIRTDPSGRTFCYALDEGLWVIGGPVNNGGVVLDWLLEHVFTEVEDVAALDDIAAGAPAGCDGLVFLPHLLGERAPHWEARARGGWFGLTISHDRSSLVRSAFEGVLLQLLTVARTLLPLAGEARELRATGGFAHSELWSQMTADIFGLPVRVAPSVEGTAWGAAVLGLKALGEIDSLVDAPTPPGEGRVYEPRAESREPYQQAVDRFEAFSGAIRALRSAD
ncbi:MAG: gluconokinase [Actinomycetota bacterium]|nr:gluconokinase [Actinomycetota bacterium]